MYLVTLHTLLYDTIVPMIEYIKIITLILYAMYSI